MFLLVLLEAVAAATPCTREGLTWGSPVAGSTEIFVSADGNDANDGTVSSPLATFEAARDGARAAILTSPSTPITVWIRGGTYTLTASFALGAQDSSPGGVTYRAWHGECVSIRGGLTIATSAFDDIDEATAARLPAGTPPARVRSLDLTSVPSLAYSDWGAIWSEPGLFSVFVDGARQPMSQYPNPGDGWMEIKQVWATGRGDGETNPIIEYKTTDDTLTAEDRHLGHEDVWATSTRDFWLGGYWRVAWNYAGIRVSSMDTATRRITLAATPNCGVGDKYSCALDPCNAFLGSLPCGYSDVEADHGRQKYVALNLLEEMDLPGEWVVDFTESRLYVYLPEGTSEVALLSNAYPLITTVDASNVSFVALDFEHSRGSAISVTGGEAVHVAGCIFRFLETDAVMITGGHGHVVTSSNFHDLGEGGVVLTGAPGAPLLHVVHNNHIYAFAQIVQIYKAAVNAGYKDAAGVAVGVTVTHNKVHHSPHMGILFGSKNGVFEWNEVYEWSRVSNDIGCFYSYSDSTFIEGNRFVHNYCHDGHDGDGFYFDRDTNSDLIEGNIAANMHRCVLHKCTVGPSNLLIEGNLFVNCSTAVQANDNAATSIIAQNVAVGPGSYSVSGSESSFDPSANQHFSGTAGDAPAWDPSALVPALSLSAVQPAFTYAKLQPMHWSQVGLLEDEYRSPADLFVCLGARCWCKEGLVPSSGRDHSLVCASPPPPPAPPPSTTATTGTSSTAPSSSPTTTSASTTSTTASSPTTSTTSTTSTTASSTTSTSASTTSTAAGTASASTGNAGEVGAASHLSLSLVAMLIGCLMASF